MVHRAEACTVHQVGSMEVVFQLKGAMRTESIEA